MRDVSNTDTQSPNTGHSRLQVYLQLYMPPLSTDGFHETNVDMAKAITPGIVYVPGYIPSKLYNSCALVSRLVRGCLGSSRPMVQLRERAVP